jgi:hypothetical protein
MDNGQTVCHCTRRRETLEPAADHSLSYFHSVNSDSCQLHVKYTLRIAVTAMHTSPNEGLVRDTRCVFPAGNTADLIMAAGSSFSCGTCHSKASALVNSVQSERWTHTKPLPFVLVSMNALNAVNDVVEKASSPTYWVESSSLYAIDFIVDGTLSMVQESLRPSLWNCPA